MPGSTVSLRSNKTRPSTPEVLTPEPDSLFASINSNFIQYQNTSTIMADSENPRNDCSNNIGKKCKIGFVTFAVISIVIGKKYICLKKYRTGLHCNFQFHEKKIFFLGGGGT